MFSYAEIQTACINALRFTGQLHQPVSLVFYLYLLEDFEPRHHVISGCYESM